jgi:amidase
MEEPLTLAETSLDRRKLLRLGAAAAAAPALAGALAERARAAAPNAQLEEATIAQLQAQLSSGAITSLQLVQQYTERIAALDRSGPSVNSVLELNPDAEAIARSLDA